MALAGPQWKSATEHEELIMLFRTISTLLPAVKDATLSGTDAWAKESTKTPNYRRSRSRKTAIFDAAAILLVRNHEIVSVISQISSGRDKKTYVKTYVTASTSSASMETSSSSSDESNTDNDDGSLKKYRATRNPNPDKKGEYQNYLHSSSLKISISTMEPPDGISELCTKTEAFISYLERNMNE